MPKPVPCAIEIKAEDPYLIARNVLKAPEVHHDESGELTGWVQSAFALTHPNDGPNVICLAYAKTQDALNELLAWIRELVGVLHLQASARFATAPT